MFINQLDCLFTNVKGERMEEDGPKPYVFQSFTASLDNTVSDFNTWHPTRECRRGIAIGHIRYIFQGQLPSIQKP